MMIVPAGMTIAPLPPLDSRLRGNYGRGRRDDDCTGRDDDCASAAAGFPITRE